MTKALEKLIDIKQIQALEPGKNYFIIVDSENIAHLNNITQALRSLKEPFGCFFVIANKRILRIIEVSKDIIPTAELQSLVSIIKRGMGEE